MLEEREKSEADAEQVITYLLFLLLDIQKLAVAGWTCNEPGMMKHCLGTVSNLAIKGVDKIDKRVA